MAQFDNLRSAPAIPGPKFVFAHIVLPHSPYLFGADGERLEQDTPFTLMESGGEDASGDGRLERYRDQAIFTSRITLETIEAIVQDFAVPPLIIVQADHGAHPRWGGAPQRLSILNAYLLPGSCKSALYPDITPVNSFRVVFNCAFGASLPLLEDRSYDSPFPRGRDYRFDPVEFPE